MCVCVCVCVLAFVLTCVCACVHACVRVCMLACVHACMLACVHTCDCARLCVYARAWMCMDLRVCLRPYVRASVGMSSYCFSSVLVCVVFVLLFYFHFLRSWLICTHLSSNPPTHLTPLFLFCSVFVCCPRVLCGSARHRAARLHGCCVCALPLRCRCAVVVVVVLLCCCVVVPALLLLLLQMQAGSSWATGIFSSLFVFTCLVGFW